MREWESIETAPRDGTCVLLYVPDGVEREGYEPVPEPIKNVTLGWFGYTADRGRPDVWCSDQVDVETYSGSELTGSWNEYEWRYVVPTHWQPLPAPPPLAALQAQKVNHE